ncbi:hypothetical protein EGT74_25410 [Chitinophaga lutea]|uniref:DUF4105 domain-containing protein n=1 Tax=Chitinophaga lutea TaxID=2488634 RepID=A0A3N4PGQ4_9BACT|nr:hypothetical protein [Chitinophaga lutea]RPE05709.1 hypothetical protein EGT74_25410 [Chitinophaga lutea]
MRCLLFLLLPLSAFSQTPTVHVIVALCDNANQGIVKVPARIGNGQDPANNLYWGCGYGVKTFLKKQPEWQFLRLIQHPKPYIPERIIFKHRTTGVHLVADAYDGAYMKTALTDFLQYAGGHQKHRIENIPAGGEARLICFVGHNGLMDFSLAQFPRKTDTLKREVAIFACASRPYFYDAIRQTGATPLIWTTHLLSPEAYTLDAMLDSWLKKEPHAVTHEKVAQAYHQYQRCGLKGARRLFATGW